MNGTVVKKGKRKSERQARRLEESIKPEGGRTMPSVEDEVRSALKFLKGRSTKATRDGMARYAIPSRVALVNTASVAVARRLADSKDATARWVGRDALRELSNPALINRLKS
jgi:hypothetical protein